MRRCHNDNSNLGRTTLWLNFSEGSDTCSPPLLTDALALRAPSHCNARTKRLSKSERNDRDDIFCWPRWWPCIRTGSPRREDSPPSQRCPRGRTTWGRSTRPGGVSPAASPAPVSDPPSAILGINRRAHRIFCHLLTAFCIRFKQENNEQETYSCKIKIIEYFNAVFPRVCISIFTNTFFIKSVNLCNLPRFMITAK